MSSLLEGRIMGVHRTPSSKAHTPFARISFKERDAELARDLGRQLHRLRTPTMTVHQACRSMQ